KRPISPLKYVVRGSISGSYVQLGGENPPCVPHRFPDGD
ncbi:hypothetical protein A2U01_0035253, partial [Trifolium medium]|nr:hypothetical protein [Trifolium medium]